MRRMGRRGKEREGRKVGRCVREGVVLHPKQNAGCTAVIWDDRLAVKCRTGLLC